MSRKRLLPAINLALVNPPRLPDAATLRGLDLPLTEDELRSVRVAMALWSDSRKPKLTWAGWQHIGFALEIGKHHADRANMPKKSMTLFLRATGFTFINDGLRWSLRKCMQNFTEINEWHATLSPSRRSTTNDPTTIWNEYNADQRGDPPKQKRRVNLRTHRNFPTLLEEYMALTEKLSALEEHRDVILELIGEIRDIADERKDQPGFADIYRKIITRR